MHDQLQTRLQELKTEYAAGEEMLAELQTRQANLERTLLRIMGAIQVLEELLAANAGPASTDSRPLPAPAPEPNGTHEGAETHRHRNASHE